MKTFNQYIFLVIFGFAGLMIIVNLYLFHNNIANSGKEYQVSISRIRQELPLFEGENGRAPVDLGELREFIGDVRYPGITGLDSIEPDGSTREELAGFLQDESQEYQVIVTDGYYYKVTYRQDDTLWWKAVLSLDGLAVLMLAVVLGTLYYVRRKILQPFHQLSELPHELAKGNLTIPLQEHPDKLFGRFVWGMDLLREHLEQSRRKELELQKEKKVLLLSLSHDIKTPLSAIKLYAAALGRNLYQNEKRKQEAADSISRKVDEIEDYLSEIVQASHEDFLHFEVVNGEFYVEQVLERIWEYYVDKMELGQIDFGMGEYENCLLSGDADRLEEVLQNVIENAIKYGDGKRIRLRARREEAYIIQVVNTGCRLPDQELPHIFESFFRGSNSSRREGSGLGLYICRQLMHLMEGEITAGFVWEEGEQCMLVEVTVRLA